VKYKKNISTSGYTRGVDRKAKDRKAKDIALITALIKYKQHT